MVNPIQRLLIKNEKSDKRKKFSNYPAGWSYRSAPYRHARSQRIRGFATVYELSYLASSKFYGYQIACFSKPLALLVEKISFWHDGREESTISRLLAE
jgi:hypothetical protein